ncbi:hypothetical protein NM688_g5460 [Phlebia brevispora]|uniref:Uncharacterized protein n=1 Tax=Phlebia brevispora TaxID=194682 RepID=A0ACC1SV49_9APHY|nr:hypothetical protein NM688_g5460 [Phlebia brevispora]
MRSRTFKVIVTGRANVGKSTLLNAVLGRNGLVHTSKKPGRTKTLNFYRVGPDPGYLVLVDAPGYGSRGRPEWGELFDHYVANRSVLKRVYILFNGKHGLNEVDHIMLQSLEEKCQAQIDANPWTLQAVITKADSMEGDVRKAIQDIQRDIFETAPTCLPGIITAYSKRAQIGIDDVRRSMVEACGLGRIEETIRHS